VLETENSKMEKDLEKSDELSLQLKSVFEKIKSELSQERMVRGKKKIFPNNKKKKFLQVVWSAVG
jgi:hypothetical protein